ncbi:hypothetical protein HK105_200254 [Polyrhizophydium stewartii]|uniref:Uncharacterized protein n=1 Tax=Polyrhizophydium stewartii TaxID=2732419 RepID=A0ABR4NKZ1_9FUNG
MPPKPKAKDNQDAQAQISKNAQTGSEAALRSDVLQAKVGSQGVAQASGMLAQPNAAGARPLDLGRPTAAIAAETATQQQATADSLDERFAHLPLRPRECEVIMECIKANNASMAIDCIRRFFKLQPQPFPPSHILTLRPDEVPRTKYNRHAEDAQMRDTILAQYLFEAA